MAHSISEKFEIDINELSYSVLDGTFLLESVSLRLQAGEILAVVGLNGSGKSTFIRLLAGLLQPTAGTIAICGRSYHSFSSDERARQIAYFGQHDDADERLLLRDYVELGTLPHRNHLSPSEINVCHK